MASQLSAFEFSSALPHLHVLGDVCPLCEQPIPHDRFDEIKSRIEARERDHVNEIGRAFDAQFAEEKRKLEASAKREAEAAAKEKLDAAERGQREAREALEQARREAAANEAKIRADATQAAHANMQQQFRQQEEARIAAEAKAKNAEDQIRAREQAFQIKLTQDLNKQREALEADKTTAINKANAAAFQERQKLLTQMQSLERKLERKTNDELGEGAEVNLYDALKAEFPDDRIERVGKGQPGADIRHVIINNGRECGTILYDSKNHGAWRTDFLTKLAADRMAARAEHAILSTRAFPAGVQQVHVERGIIVANPARVCALVQIVRQHIMHGSMLKLSAEARTQKTAALYDFITSERCNNLLSRIDQLAEEMLDIQVQEKKAHDRTWRRQGELCRTIQRTRADLCGQIDNIVSETGQ